MLSKRQNKDLDTKKIDDEQRKLHKKTQHDTKYKNTEDVSRYSGESGIIMRHVVLVVLASMLASMLAVYSEIGHDSKLILFKYFLDHQEFVLHIHTLLKIRQNKRFDNAVNSKALSFLMFIVNQRHFEEEPQLACQLSHNKTHRERDAVTQRWSFCGAQKQKLRRKTALKT